MDLSPGQQRLLFVVIVIALVGLGIFLIEGRSHGTTAAPATTPTSTPSASTASASATSAAATYVPPSIVPAATPSPSTTGGANIYQWLPFTQSDLTAAAKTTIAFAADYATWSPAESTTAYGAKMAALVTTQEDQTLEDDYATAAHNAGGQVFSGTGSIDSISSFGPATNTNQASITFDVVIATTVTSSKKAKTTSTSTYNITVVSTGTSWQVDNIELTSVGNQ